MDLGLFHGNYGAVATLKQKSSKFRKIRKWNDSGIGVRFGEGLRGTREETDVGQEEEGELQKRLEIAESCVRIHADCDPHLSSPRAKIESKLWTLTVVRGSGHSNHSSQLCRKSLIFLRVERIILFCILRFKSARPRAKRRAAAMEMKTRAGNRPRPGRRREDRWACKTGKLRRIIYRTR